MRRKQIFEATVETLKKMIAGLDICMIITTDEEGQRHNRPMAAIKIDDNGYCWFFASKSSGKLKDLAVNNKLQIVFANPGNEEYIEIHGTATVVCDTNEIEDKWSPMVTEWFRGGKTDPEVCLVRVEMTNVFYWDAIAEGIQRLAIKTTTVVESQRLAA